nr:retrotransposon Orf1 [Ipomoea batatas]
MPTRTRHKEQAKKRRHDERDTSSGAAEGQSDVVVPGGRGLGHLDTIQLVRVEDLQSKVVSGGYYFDYPLLDSYGCREEVERLTSQPYWEHLFSWRDDTYVPVVYEFIATFESTEESHQFTPSVKFTMFGQQYHLSMNQLGIYLGFYTQEYMYSDEFQNLRNDFDTEASLEEYWHRITGGTVGRFTGKKHNTAAIRSPALKALKLLLGLTFGGRHKNLHKIYQIDLFRLWSLEMNEPIQMACMVKQWLQTQVHEKCPYV